MFEDETLSLSLSSIVVASIPWISGALLSTKSLQKYSCFLYSFCLVERTALAAAEVFSKITGFEIIPRQKQETSPSLGPQRERNRRPFTPKANKLPLSGSPIGAENAHSLKALEERRNPMLCPRWR